MEGVGEDRDTMKQILKLEFQVFIGGSGVQKQPICSPLKFYIFEWSDVTCDCVEGDDMETPCSQWVCLVKKK